MQYFKSRLLLLSVVVILSAFTLLGASYDFYKSYSAQKFIVADKGSSTYEEITQTKVGQWNTAYSWSNHAGLYTPIAHKTTEDALNGLVKVNGAGTYSAITDSSTNWNTAYTDRLKWDGGSTGLNATTGRTSLGLGTAATVNTEASVAADGNVPTGQAVINYVGIGTPNELTDSSTDFNSTYKLTFLNPTCGFAINMADTGETTGDIRYLINIGAAMVTVYSSASVALSGGVSYVMEANDTLTIMWTGSKWVEIARSNN